MTFLTDHPALLALVSFGVLSGATWLGARFFRLRPAAGSAVYEDFGLIQGATLTLLGLIIGFSFSMAVGRYDQRKNFEEEEANAIGTEYVRMDLLPGAAASSVRNMLAGYVGQRILFYTIRDAETLAEVNVEDGQDAGRDVVCGRGVGVRPAQSADGIGGVGHERCAQRPGLCTGGIAEPDSDHRVGVDGERLPFAGA